MPTRFKITFSILLFIGLLVLGFMYLLRGCLSKYDERAALPDVLYFEKGNDAVVFSIVKFEKATSYSRSGGMIRKSVSTSYYIQTNDALTGNKLAEKKIKHHSDIKNYPIEVMGSTSEAAWVFMGEPMSFDPFTLEKLVDIKTLESKNPSLKSKFPLERRFYRFDKKDKNIYFTATDGSTWLLNTNSLQASPHDPDEELEDTRVEFFEKQLKDIQVAHDSLMERKLRRPSRMLAAREIDMTTYRKMMAGFNEEQSALYKKRDSIQKFRNAAETFNRGLEDLYRRIETLNERTSVNFSQMKVNADTVGTSWYGLFSKKEIDGTYNRFTYQSLYNETARRQLYKTQWSLNNNGDAIYTKENAAPTSDSYFLDGGFLLSKETGLPTRINNSFLVIFRNQIGNEAKIQLSRVDRDGKVEWTFDSQLKEWGDYIYTGKQLIITGTDNKELSSDQCNVLWCVDLSNGKAAKHDYYMGK